MNSEHIEKYIKECEHLEIDFKKGSTELFLREYTTYSGCIDKLSEFNIKTKEDFQKKILSPMCNLTINLTNHYYFYKHYDMILS